jgi:hypothetical protein
MGETIVPLLAEFPVPERTLKENWCRIMVQVS